MSMLPCFYIPRLFNPHGDGRTNLYSLGSAEYSLVEEAGGLL
jgi:hypothetical protein